MTILIVLGMLTTICFMYAVYYAEKSDYDRLVFWWIMGVVCMFALGTLLRG